MVRRTTKPRRLPARPPPTAAASPAPAKRRQSRDTPTTPAERASAPSSLPAALARIETLESQIAALQVRVTDAHTAMAGVRERIMDKVEVVNFVDERLEPVLEAVASVARDVTALEERLYDLEHADEPDTPEDVEDRLSDLESSAEHASERLDELSESLQEVDARVDVLEERGSLDPMPDPVPGPTPTSDDPPLTLARHEPVPPSGSALQVPERTALAAQVETLQQAQAGTRQALHLLLILVSTLAADARFTDRTRAAVQTLVATVARTARDG